MSLVPTLDLRASDSELLRSLPFNLEAEQALLGALLYDNGAFERLDDSLRAECFHEPLHVRLYEVIESSIRKGALAEPILIHERFAGDKDYEDMGGVRYLATLVDHAPPAANAPQYAKVIYDLHLDREHLLIANDAAAMVMDRGEMSARERIEETESRLFMLAENNSGSGIITFATAVQGAVQMAAAAHSRDGGLAGLSTGLIDLDQKIGGMHPSDLIILAARPSMGKSALAANIGFDVARHYAWEPQPDGSHKTVRGGKVLFDSLEMSADQLAMRVLGEVSGVPSDRLRKGEIDVTEFGRVRDAALEIQDAPFFIDDTGALKLAKLAARARRHKRRHGLDLLIVDYLQLVDAGLPGKDNRVQQVSAITQGLKALAKELAIPVIALAQLSRQVENRDDKKPQLSDLRESGSIEQDADMVLFIYREAYYLSRLEPKPGTEEHFKWQAQMDEASGVAEIIIGKQRHGPIGTVRVSFNEDLTKFGNLARESGRYGRNPAGND